MPSNVKPSRRSSRAGSSALRPSMSDRRAHRSCTAPPSRGRRSTAHSVTSTAASAPATAASALSHRSTPVQAVGRRSVDDRVVGVTTSAPSASRRAASTRLDASRMSSVSGLKARPSSATRLPSSVPEVLLELADDPALLQLVDLDHRGQQLEVVARVAGELLEGGRRPSGSRSRRSRCRRAGTTCRCAGRGPCRAATTVDVGADLLADVGDLVDEADLRGEEGVRGVLDHLRARAPWCARSARRAGRRARPRGRRRSSSNDADHHAVRVEEVGDRRALLQELGVGAVADLARGRARRARRARARRCRPARCSS